MDWQAMYSDMKDLPYYKSIVKSVLSKHIQLMLEEISSEVGEESLIMTVNPQTGTISHHGSHRGKVFLQNTDDLKTQFLTFCKTSASQNSPSSHNQEEQPTESRKRKNVTNESGSPNKLQKKSTPKSSETSQGPISNKHPYTLRKSRRSIVREILSKKSMWVINKSKKKSNQHLASDPTTNQSLPKVVSTNQNLPEVVSTNQSSPDDDSTNQNLSQVISTNENLLEEVSTNLSSSEVVSTNQSLPEVEETNQNFLPLSIYRASQSVQFSAGSNVIAVEGFISKTVSHDHLYSLNLNSNETSELDGSSCSDKDSLTNYYNTAIVNRNQQLIPDQSDVKQEEEENRIGCYITYGETDCEIATNTLDSLDNIVQIETVSGADKPVVENEPSVQLNGVDINFRTPRLQPIVRLETFNPNEKRITNNRDRTSTNTSQNSQSVYDHVEPTHIEEVHPKLSEESNLPEVNSNSAKDSETTNEASTSVNKDEIKEEVLDHNDGPNDGPVRTRKAEVSSNMLTRTEGAPSFRSAGQDGSSHKVTVSRKQEGRDSRREEPLIDNSIVTDIKLEDGTNDKPDDTRIQDNEDLRNNHIKTKACTSKDAQHCNKETMSSQTSLVEEDDVYEDDINEDFRHQETGDSQNQEIQDSQKQKIQSSQNQEIQDSQNKKNQSSQNQEIQDSQNKKNQSSQNQEIQDSQNQEIRSLQKQRIRDSQIPEIQDTHSKDIQDSQNKVIQKSKKLSKKIKDSRFQNIKMKKRTSKDSQQRSRESSQIDNVEENTGLDDGLSNKRGDTRNHQMSELGNLEDSQARRSSRCRKETILKDFIGEDVTLEEDDNNIEDMDVTACFDSGTEWNQSDYHEDDSSDDDDDNVVEDVEDQETQRTKQAPEKVPQLSDKYIYDENGDLLGRNLEDRRKLKCVKNEGIYMTKIIRENQNSKRCYFYDGRNICVYCGKMFSKIWRHFKDRHKEEPLVLEILDLQVNRDLNRDGSVKEKLEKLIAMKQMLLRNKGTHEHNLRVIKNKKGELLVARRRKKAFNSDVFGNCPECFEWLDMKNGYFRHKCLFAGEYKPSTLDALVQTHVIQGRILGSISQEMMTEVVPIMPQDRLTKTAKYDPLITALGQYYFTNSYGKIERRRYQASNKMRVAARLVHFFRKEIKSDIASMSDCLQVEHFDLLAKCAVLAASKNSEKELKYTGFCKKLGHDLFIMSSAKVGGLKRDKKDKVLEDAKKFHSQLQEHWEQTLEAQIKILNEERKAQQETEEELIYETGAEVEKDSYRENPANRHGHEEMSTSQKHDKPIALSIDKKPRKVPVQESSSKEKISENNENQNECSDQAQTISNEFGNSMEEESNTYENCDPEDFVQIAKYLLEELDKQCVPDAVSTPEKYRYLVTLSLVCLVLYNSCDAEKIQVLTYETYKRRLRHNGETDRNLYKSLTILEKELLKTQDLIELKSSGTKHRMEDNRLYGSYKVPIILPPGMAKFLNHLADPTVRQNCFVESGNNHLFATFDSEQDPLSLEVALDLVKENVKLNRPSGITLKNVKKYTSTICQVTSLSEERLLQFVREMGLLEKLNLEEGQSISSIKDCLGIAKLIYLQERGKTEKLRTLQDISFDEIESEPTTKDSSTLCDFGPWGEEDLIEDYATPKPRQPRRMQDSSTAGSTRIPVPWSKAENEEIYQYFGHYINLQSRRAYPGIAEILRVCNRSKAMKGEIWKRDSPLITAKVRKLVEKSRKKLDSDSEDSD